MLAIRMQRTGRKGHAMFRVIVQDARLTPTSGRVVAQIGHYDPHTKAISIEKEKAALYLSNGAQPSERVARLLKSEGVKLPDWVKFDTTKTSTIRNQEKLRKNRTPEPVAEEPVVESEVETPVAEAEAPEVVEAPVETVAAEEEVVEVAEAPVAEDTTEEETEETPAKA